MARSEKVALEVVRLTRQGKTIREIADIVGIGETTVSVYKKWAVENGLFPDYQNKRYRRPFDKLVALVNEGKKNPEIAAALGVNASEIARWKMVARRAGLLPPFGPKSSYQRAVNLMAYRSDKLGSMKMLLDGLPAQVIDWLVEETPEGAKIADTVRGIVLDCYEEERGAA